MNFRLNIYYFVLIGLGGLLFYGCQNKERDTQHSVVKKKKAPENFGSLDALPLTVYAPVDNPLTNDKKELGRLLFYDPILSGNRDVACATCHHPDFGYAENIDISIGVNGVGLGEKRKFKPHNNIPFTKRNAQSLLNTAFNGINESGIYAPEVAPMFWDLRTKSLESQAIMPIKALEEMRGQRIRENQILVIIEKRLNQIPEYVQLFKRAFPGIRSISMDHVAKTIATFERSLVANNSRFDHYMRGNKSALSGREIEGMNLFIISGCARCHHGPMFSDFKTHVMGIDDNEKLSVSDSGFEKSYAFRTPSLRNLRLTRPYMHSGKVHTLEHVLDFYEELHGKDLPNRQVSRIQLDTLAQKVKLEFKNIRPILEFLNTLNDENFDKKIPGKVPSGMVVGGRIRS